MLLSTIRTITRFYPLQTPRASLLRLLPNVPAGYGPFRSDDANCFNSYPPGGDLVVKNLFYFGNFDPWVGRTLARLTRLGDVICDVGANIGDTALPLAKIVGSNGHVYAFEPLRAIRDCLMENVRANALNNLTVVEIALSDMVGELAIDVPEGQPGMASVQNTDTSSGVRVPTLPFDDWIKTVPIESVAVCKVDVEGHEEAVFRGMAKSLAAKRIGSIVFERHGRAGLKDPVIEMLAGHGFRIFQIRKRPIRVAYVDVGKEGPGKPTADFVAVLAGGDQEKMLIRP